jgi:hypothetical protein
MFLDIFPLNVTRRPSFHVIITSDSLQNSAEKHASSKRNLGAITQPLNVDLLVSRPEDNAGKGGNAFILPAGFKLRI